MSRRLVTHRARHRTNAVEIFHLASLAERFVARETHRHVDVRSQGSLVEVRVAHAEMAKEALERLDRRRCLLRRAKIGRGDDLHERAPRAVEVYERRVSRRGRLARVRLELEALDAERARWRVRRGGVSTTRGFDAAASLVFGFWSLVRGGERDVEDAAEDDGAAVLGDLVPVREIRVEVVFAIEVTDALDLAAEGEAEARGEVHRARVHGGKRAGERGVEGSDVRVHVAAVIAGGAARRGEGRRVSHRGAGSRERGGTGEESRAEIGTAVARTHPEKSFVSSASWTCSSRPTIVSHPSSSPATSATDEAALDIRRAREETPHDAARWSPATREETRDAVSTARRSAHRDDIAGGGIGDARGRLNTGLGARRCWFRSSRERNMEAVVRSQQSLPMSRGPTRLKNRLS